MPRASSIASRFLLLLAITALAFTSCNVARKSAGKKNVPQAAVEQSDRTDPGVPEDNSGDPATEEPSTVTGRDEALEDPTPEIPYEEETAEPQTDEPGQGETADGPDEAIGEEIPENEIPFEDDTPEESSGIDSDDTSSPVPSGDGAAGTSEDAGEDAGEPEGDPEDFVDVDMEETTAGTYRPEEEEEAGPEMKVVDFEADIMRPINITEDSTALNLLGNVVFYHNGAVITCDSAVRYSEKRMDCFKRVVINNGTTYVYGDRAEYNGETNTARVFSPIIKMVDEDAVLYTYRFSFNTLTKVGRYSGGGVLTQQDNRMESQRGYYDTEQRLFTGAGEVELINPDYKLVSDSVRYNLDTEVAEFFTTTHIWNQKGEILIADRGRYRSATTDYEFTRNSYILTDNQEIWADTLIHNSEEDYTELRKDIQIIDEENNSMAFGDYGEYWGETEQGMLTLDPSLVSFDPEEPSDTLYMRADSMFFYTYDYDIDFFAAEAQPTGEIPLEELIETPLPPAGTPDGTVIPGGPVEFDENGQPIFPDGVFPEGIIAEPGDGTVVIIPPEEPGEPFAPDDLERLTETVETEPGTLIDLQEELESAHEASSPNRENELRMSRRERRAAGRASQPPATGEENIVQEEPPSEENQPIGEVLPEPDLILPVEDGESATEPDAGDGDGETDPEAGDGEEGSQPEPVEPYTSPYAGLARILQESIVTDSTGGEISPAEFWLQVGEEIESDSLKLEYYTGIIEELLASGGLDSLGVAVPPGDAPEIIGTLVSESAAERTSLAAQAPAEAQDSLQRVFYGYRDVRIFREDFQAVCDSIVGFSKDSTMHLHIDPVMWSDQNQVTSDVMVIFTRDEQLYKAEFTGNPFMASEVDSTRYNQVKGKFMVAWFEDNSIYRHDVFGNGQNYYYMEDDKTGEIDGFMTVECADITYYIDDNQIDEIRWRLDPVYWIYPIDMIPPDVDEFLPGFTWQIDRRPMTREDVFNRRIRPRRREEVLAVPHPEFPITRQLDEDRERLTKQNLWRDRNDRLSPEAIEFMRYVQLRDAEGELVILPREQEESDTE